jgi:serine/threonine protein kinase
VEGAGTKPAEQERSAVLGRTIAGKFLIESYLGGGAMGAVYRARQIALDKDVAIKLLHGQHAGDPMFAARFQREAKAASKLDHPNSVRVIDFGQEPDGLLYIAMEFLDGRDLFHVIQEDWPLSPTRIADVVSQALAAIAVAHDMGVVHRDLKPENIMVQRGTDDEGNPRDVVKVCDFGIAKFTDLRQDTPTGGGGQKLTTQGIVVGTPEYMSPEQAKGEALDARSDLYSLGIILYQMLSGRVPFDADTALGVVLKHVTEEAVPPREVNPAADEGLQAICLKAMRKKREDRYQSARDMRADLKSSLARLDPAVHAAAVQLPSSRTDPHAPTALAIDSASVAAAAVRAAAVTESNLTPAGTAAIAAQGEPARSRGWLVALALLVVGGAGAGVWMMRARAFRPPVSIEAPAPAIASPPPPATTANAAPVHAAATDLPPQEPSKVAPAKALTLPPASPATPGAKALATSVAAPPPAPAPEQPPPAPVLTATPVPPVALTTSTPVVTAPATPAPVPAAFDASHAHVDFSVINAGGGATPSAVQRALSRKAGGWTHCYRSGLERRAERIEGSGVMHLTTDESGNVVGARINGFDAMPGVKTCIAGEAHVHLDNVDTGDAWADVQLTFKAE